MSNSLLDLLNANHTQNHTATASTCRASTSAPHENYLKSIALMCTIARDLEYLVLDIFFSFYNITVQTCRS